MVSPFALFRHLERAPELLAVRRQTPAFRELVVRYLGIGKPSYPIDLPLSGGGVLRLSNQVEVQVFWQIFVRKCYRLWNDCRTIVDAGANVGIFSVWVAKQLPEARIIAVEPFPRTYAALQHNVRVNDLEDRIQAVQIALAAQSRERLMQTDADSPDRSLLPEDETGNIRNAVQVRCTSLADFFDQQRLSSVDLLKMDIEGSEWEVLFSTPISVLQCIRRIDLEYHEVHARFGYSAQQLFAHLGKAGHVLTYRQEDKHRTGLAVFERG